MIVANDVWIGESVSGAVCWVGSRLPGLKEGSPDQTSPHLSTTPEHLYQRSFMYPVTTDQVLSTINRDKMHGIPV